MQDTTDTGPDFRRVFESIPGLYVVVDRRMRIVAATDGYFRATMTVREEVMGVPLFDVFPRNPEDTSTADARSLQTSINRVLATGAPSSLAVVKYDIPRRASDGGGYEERYWSARNTPVVGADGEVEYVIHCVEDVTDYMRLMHDRADQDRHAERLQRRASGMERQILARSHELQDANEKLRDYAAKMEEVTRLKSQFLAMASHELRTPLTAIEGFSSTMLHRWPQFDDDEKLHFVEIIDRQSRRLSHLVADLLTLSEVESGKLRLHLEPVDVSIAIKQAVHALGVEQAVRVSTPGNPVVLADEGHLQQLLINFLSNARKYGRPPIEIDASRSDAWLDISVADHGAGVPEEFVPHLFDSFARAAATQDISGTGLGLTIVRGLVEAQGGSVWYEPNEPEGARFRLRLPLQHDQSRVDVRFSHPA